MFTAAAHARQPDTTRSNPNPPTRNAKNMGNQMCNLQTHIDRDHRIVEAQRLEPVYTKLATEYGIEYQPPAQEA
jgi:hypothetical protein